MLAVLCVGMFAVAAIGFALLVVGPRRIRGPTEPDPPPEADYADVVSITIALAAGATDALRTEEALATKGGDVAAIGARLVDALLAQKAHWQYAAALNGAPMPPREAAEA